MVLEEALRLSFAFGQRHPERALGVVAAPGTHAGKPASAAGLEPDREGFGDDAAAVAALRMIEGAPGDGAGRRCRGRSC